MRTYVFIGYLAIIINLQFYKVTSTSDHDLYLAYEEGSGDLDGGGPLTAPPYAAHPDDEEEGSGARPDNKGGGGGAPPPDEDAELDYYDAEDYRDSEYDLLYPRKEDREDPMEGSGTYPIFDDVDMGDDDFKLEAPRPDIFEEIVVKVDHEHEHEHASPPESMPSSTPPPTLTDNHPDMDNNNIRILTQKDDERQVSIFAQPGILAAFIGGAVMGLLCAILLVMFIVYRMRKRDEGSYPLDEPKRVPLTSSYSPNDKEIYA